jgi:hypothetical protein
LSDPSRLAELRDFYAGAEAVVRIDDKPLVVRLPGPPGANDEMVWRVYLQTWLALVAARGNSLTAELRDE